MLCLPIDFFYGVIIIPYNMSCYFILTFCFTITPIIIIIIILVTSLDDLRLLKNRSFITYLSIQLTLWIINLFYSIYIFINTNTKEFNNENRQINNVDHKIYHLICEDCVTAICIPIFLFHFAWIIYGKNIIISCYF